MTAELPPSAGTDGADQVMGADRAVPPYDGRKESADVDPVEGSTEDGVTVGGARRPTEAEPGLRRTDPQESARGPVASPAEEQPAASSGGDDPGEASVGPAHQSGVGRAEDKS
ncbi:MAG: hypothetical protein ABJA87_09725 [bacterium]